MKILLFGLLMLLNSCLDFKSGISGRPTVDTGPISLEVPGSTENSRPDEKVFIENNYCVCLNGQSDSLGNCGNFCLNKNVTVPTLYVETELDPEIELNTAFRDTTSNSEEGTLLGWCFNQINPDEINPSCLYVTRDEQGAERTFNINITQSTNNFTVELNNADFPYDETFVTFLREQTSGAQSQPFQIKRKEYEDPANNQQFLSIVPINMYTCFNTAGSYDGVTRTYDFSIRQYFYFPINNEPSAVPPTDNPPKLFCHDWFDPANSYIDSLSYPRLELINQQFNLWNGNDSRFFDQDANTVLDINDYIQAELANRANIVTGAQFFTEFNWPKNPDINDPNNAAGPTSQGYLLQPFVDSNSQEVFCPDSEDYQFSGTLFSILGEVIGVDTEAIFIGEREPEAFEDGNGQPIPAPATYMLIRESLLKTIWFYFDGERRRLPANEQISKTQTIHFFWPPCTQSTCDPTVPFSPQRLFTIKGPNELFGNTSNQFGFRNNLSPADKRFGCVPKGMP